MHVSYCGVSKSMGLRRDRHGQSTPAHFSLVDNDDISPDHLDEDCIPRLFSTFCFVDEYAGERDKQALHCRQGERVVSSRSP